MKTFGKNSISSILRIAIDLMLITEVIALLYRLVPIISKYNSIYGNSPIPSIDPAAKYLFYTHISVFIFGLVAILITLQLRKLLSAFKKEVIFELKNVKRIKIISVLLLLYVLSEFVFALYKQYLGIHIGDGFGMIEKVSITDIYTFKSIVSAIDFKLLFVSIVIYIISCVFLVGNDLNEQSALTI
jgi:hypothetical protein